MEFLSVIDRKREEIIKLADTVWENPELLVEAKREHPAKTGGKYDPAMPADVMPHL